MENTLDAPPFPPLKWDDTFWTGAVVLSAWAGFRTKILQSTEESSGEGDGSARVILATPGNANVPPSPEQAAAFQYLLDHQEAVLQKLLDAVFEQFLEVQEEIQEDYDEDEIEAMAPDIDGADQLKTLMRFANIHVLTPTKDGVAYLGFEFDCTWEEEHGVGVMLHKDRVVACGGADSAFLEWIAQNDADGKANA